MECDPVIRIDFDRVQDSVVRRCRYVGKEFIHPGHELVPDLNALSIQLVDDQPGYEISVEKNHDVYDCFYIALARNGSADKLVTTDRDFEQLCERGSFEYVNPVPEDVLKQFHTVNA